MKKLLPFITSTNMKPRKTKKNEGVIAPVEVPAGFSNLYDYEEEKRVIAGKLFQKMLESEVQNLKDMFMLWTGKGKKMTP